MFPSAYLLVLLAQPVQPVLKMTPGTASVDFEWSDVEDRIQGSVTPRRPIEGKPLDVSAHVGTFQGVEFDGPVTISLKEKDSRGGGQSVTLKRAKGEKAWRTSFTPGAAGPYTLEISFQTTRHKVASGTIEVEDAPLSRWPWWALIGVLAVGALGFGVWSMFKKQENA